MNINENETIDKLFLELSQVTRATTAKEIALQGKVALLCHAIAPFAVLVETTSGRIPYENLSAANWHTLVKAFNAQL